MIRLTSCFILLCFRKRKSPLFPPSAEILFHPCTRRYAVFVWIHLYYVKTYFNKSYFPEAWKTGFIIRLYKKGDKENIENYSVLANLLELLAAERLNLKIIIKRCVNVIFLSMFIKGYISILKVIKNIIFVANMI